MASMSLDRVISMQITEGGTDSVVFENFLYRTLNSLRQRADIKDKHIIVLMDNATIHKHSMIQETAK
jgi:hypothetical protein